ncbi:MFS transporter, partial [Paenibacillus sepulcri]|nr:MFS transporter [Paenibacillus sepulcri]
LALFFASTLLYPAIHSLLLLLALRAIHGGSYGMSSTMTGAMAAELIPAARKGEGIGYFSMFMSLAMVIGPFLGLTLVHQANYTVLFIVCICLTAFSLLFGFLTKEAPKEASVKNKPFSLSWSSIVEAKALPVSLAGFVLAFSYSSLTSFISVFAKEIDLTEVASYFFVVFAVMIVLPRPIIGKIFDRYGEHVLAYPGIALFVIGMLILGSAHSPAVFLLSGAVIGLGHGAIIPCFQTVALRSAPSGRSGLATGTFFLMFDLGYGIGSYVLGVVAQHTHYETMYHIAGLLVILSGVVYYVLHHRVQSRTQLGKAV